MHNLGTCRVCVCMLRGSFELAQFVFSDTLSAMLRRRTAPRPVGRMLLPAALATRHYEYPGVGVTSRSQPYAWGDKLPDTNNYSAINARDKDSMYLTGSHENPAYTIDMICSTEADVGRMSQRYSNFRGHTKYALDPVTDRQCEAAAELLAATDVTKVWAAVLKDYPSLKTPLDEPTQKTIIDFYAKTLPKAQDEAFVASLALPLMRRMLEEKCLSQPYWWRFQEHIAAQMTTQSARGGFQNRAVHLVTERVTKILYNQFNELPWASDDYVAPHMMDICGNRAFHQAGFW